jgi:thiosulfate dehydrogenase (quinone) large subunit
MRRRVIVIYARLALGLGFLSAVADRLGLWGAPGQSNVAWGDFAHFLVYTAKLNPYLPPSAIPAVGWLVTLGEVTLGVALILGIRLRTTALLSGVLLAAFACGMTMGTGVKTAFDASVFAASATAFLLALEVQPSNTASAGPSRVES